MGRKRQSETDAGDAGLGSMFRSFGNFLDFVSSLAEQAEEEGGEVTRTGELGDAKKGVKAVYGFSVRVGGGGGPRIEQFGNVKSAGRGSVVEEAREPMVDVFDEGDHVVLVAELPGVDASDIHFEVNDDTVSLRAARGERKYRKDVVLPSPVAAAAAAPSFRNGIFELKLPKAT